MDENNSGQVAMNETQEQPQVPQETPQDPQDATPENPDGEEPRKKSGYDKLKAKLERERAEKEELRRENELLKKPQSPAVPSEKPKLDDYENWDAFIEATAEWKVEQKLTERDTKEREKSLKAETQAKQQTYAQKAQEFAKSTPDFLDTLEESEAPMNDMLHQAIVDSDLGPQVAYYLAKNPEEAAKMVKMGYGELNRYLGKIEVKLESKPAPKTTNAPPPINPARGSASSSVNPYERDLSPEEYKAWRAKQKR